jgi:hypothetical protein
MADEVNKPGEGEGEAAVPSDEPKIMCYISKQMVPLKDTVEVEYGGGKKFRVLPKYIKFEQDES